MRVLGSIRIFISLLQGEQLRVNKAVDGRFGLRHYYTVCSMIRRCRSCGEDTDRGDGLVYCGCLDELVSHASYSASLRSYGPLDIGNFMDATSTF